MKNMKIKMALASLICVVATFFSMTSVHATTLFWFEDVECPEELWPK